MKTKSLIILLLGVLSTEINTAGITGYVNHSFVIGQNLFGNPLYDYTNTLSSLFSGGPPEGTTVSLWDPATLQYSTTSAFLSGAWTVDLAMPLGQGALLTTPSPFTNTFVGEVRGPNGETSDPWDPPPPFSGPDGLYLLSSIPPIVLSGAEVFTWILGRDPTVNEQFTRLNADTQTYETTTYLGGGVWSNGEPQLNVSEAAFFNVGPVVVPEPTAFTLLGLGSLALMMVRRRSPNP